MDKSRVQDLESPEGSKTAVVLETPSVSSEISQNEEKNVEPLEPEVELKPNDSEIQPLKVLQELESTEKEKLKISVETSDQDKLLGSGEQDSESSEIKPVQPSDLKQKESDVFSLLPEVDKKKAGEEDVEFFFGKLKVTHSHDDARTGKPKNLNNVKENPDDPQPHSHIEQDSKEILGNIVDSILQTGNEQQISQISLPVKKEKSEMALSPEQITALSAAVDRALTDAADEYEKFQPSSPPSPSLFVSEQGETGEHLNLPISVKMKEITFGFPPEADLLQLREKLLQKREGKNDYDKKSLSIDEDIFLEFNVDQNVTMDDINKKLFEAKRDEPLIDPKFLNIPPNMPEIAFEFNPETGALVFDKRLSMKNEETFVIEDEVENFIKFQEEHEIDRKVSEISLKKPKESSLFQDQEKLVLYPSLTKDETGPFFDVADSLYANFGEVKEEKATNLFRGEALEDLTLIGRDLNVTKNPCRCFAAFEAIKHMSQDPKCGLHSNFNNAPLQMAITTVGSVYNMVQPGREEAIVDAYRHIKQNADPEDDDGYSNLHSGKVLGKVVSGAWIDENASFLVEKESKPHAHVSLGQNYPKEPQIKYDIDNKPGTSETQDEQKSPKEKTKLWKRVLKPFCFK